MQINNFMNEHKSLIGTLYDLVEQSSMTVDEAISKGKIKDIVNSKFGESILKFEKEVIQNVYIRV